MSQSTRLQWIVWSSCSHRWLNSVSSQDKMKDMNVRKVLSQKNEVNKDGRARGENGGQK